MKKLALTSALILASTTGCMSSIQSVIKDSKYQPITPPNNLVEPGTIVNIVSENPLVLERVCSQKAALGENLVVPKSETASTTIAQKLDKSSTIDVGYDKVIKAKLQAKGLSNVTLSLSNVNILELSVDKVVERQDQQSTGCTTAVKKYLADPKTKLTMIMSVLQADADYKLDWSVDVTVDVGLEKELVQGLGLSVGSVNKTDKSITVKGKGLYWGMRAISSTTAIGLKPPGTRGDGTTPVAVKDMKIIDVSPALTNVEIRTSPDFADN